MRINSGKEPPNPHARAVRGPCAAIVLDWRVEKMKANEPSTLVVLDGYFPGVIITANGTGIGVRADDCGTLRIPIASGVDTEHPAKVYAVLGW